MPEFPLPAANICPSGPYPTPHEMQEYARAYAQVCTWSLARRGVRYLNLVVVDLKPVVVIFKPVVANFKLVVADYKVGAVDFKPGAVGFKPE
jgi:hypothetical protein